MLLPVLGLRSLCCAPVVYMSIRRPPPTPGHLVATHRLSWLLPATVVSSSLCRAASAVHRNRCAELFWYTELVGVQGGCKLVHQNSVEPHGVGMGVWGKGKHGPDVSVRCLSKYMLMRSGLSV